MLAIAHHRLKLQLNCRIQLFVILYIHLSTVLRVTIHLFCISFCVLDCPDMISGLLCANPDKV